MAEVSGKKISELRVIDLKHQLEKRGLDRNGVKQVLLQRLSEALEEEGHDPETFVFGKKQKSQDEGAPEEPEQDGTDRPHDAEQPEEVVEENGVDSKSCVVEEEEHGEEEHEEEEEAYMDVELENFDDHQIQDMEVCNDKEDTDNCSEKKQTEKEEKGKPLDTPRPSKPHVIWVMNLNTNTNAVELKAAFMVHAVVMTARILTAKSPYYEVGTLFGHLEMASKEDADKAISAMDKYQYKGKTIRVLNYQDFLKEKNKYTKPQSFTRPPGFKAYDRSKEDGRRHFVMRRSPPGEPPYRRQTVPFHMIKKERERQGAVYRDRQWEEERKRQMEDAEVSRKYKQESIRLQREHEKLRREKEKLKREREELERLERQRERFEREKLHKERLELERSVFKLEEDRGRNYPDERFDDDDHDHEDFENQKRYRSRSPRRSSHNYRGVPSFQSSYRGTSDRPKYDRGRNERHTSNRYQDFDNDRWIDNGRHYHHAPSGSGYAPRNDRYHYTAPMNRY